MAETCIVCLGDLANGDSSTHATSNPPTPDLLAADQSGGAPLGTDVPSTETIAQLLPCHHRLHNECLKPWVERANSCPICRQSFNEVELRLNLLGPLLSSYTVEDKRQVAELDPGLIVEEDFSEQDDAHVEVCMVCEECGDDEVLLLCDGCNNSCHTFCCDLDEVPAGAWFCPYCQEEGALASARPERQRARRSHERLRSVRDCSPSAWARVWQSVWSRLHLDLDFPFDDDVSTPQRAPPQRRDFEQWQERFRVAQRQGGAARFRDTAATLLDFRIDPVENSNSKPESQEELRAWNAFDKAKELQNGPCGTRAKRKSPTASPTESTPQPERKLKRPRTRRNQEVEGSGAGPSTRVPLSEVRCPPIVTQSQRNRPESITAGPSFLQSLLDEVEHTGKSETGSNYAHSPIPPVSNTGQDCLSLAPSPGASPISSNHPSPSAQSTTPPSFHISRPSSPPLTSRIEPIFAQNPEFSPFSPTERERERALSDNSSTVSKLGSCRASNPSPTSRSPAEASPKRPHINLATKEEIQTLVKAALRPLYSSQRIDREQYTDINREISRMLYDRIADAGGLADALEKEKWKQIALDEVDNAVRSL